MTISRMLAATMVAGAPTTRACTPTDVSAPAARDATRSGDGPREGLNARRRSWLHVAAGRASTVVGFGAR
jgi:hypothetical protein